MSRERVDVLVVGGGPAGLAAAVELRRAGAGRVLVVDREEQAGGVPRLCEHAGFGLRDLGRAWRGPRYAATYLRLAAAHGVEVATSTTATGWAGPRTLELTGPDGLREVGAGAVLLATGCRERPRAARLVPGARPLGVLTTGALQRLAQADPRAVGRRAVIVGAEHVSFSALRTLAGAGASVAAMVTELPRHQTFALLDLAARLRWRVPLITASRVTRISGRSRVEAVEVTEEATGRSRRIACDTVVFSGDWIPEHELARTGGLAMDPRGGGPRVDQRLRTSAPGVFAAGNLLHAAETADVAALDGRHAAASIRDWLDTGAWPAATLEVGCDPPLRWVAPSAVSPGAGPPPRGRLVLRTAEFRTRARLAVHQGERQLWRGRARRLVPCRSISVPAGWLERVEQDGGAVTIRILP